MIENYRIELSDETVIVTGAGTQQELGDGPYNFTKACYTTNGHIFVEWGMGKDDPDDPTQLAGEKYAVSEDGGKTWRKMTDADIPVTDVTLPDGDLFAFFNSEPNISNPSWLSSYQKQVVDVANASFNVYFAEDIAEFGGDTVAFNKIDPDTDEKQTVNATFHWPYMPMVVGDEDNLVRSLSTWITLGNWHGMIEKNGVLYFCLYSPGFDSSAQTKEEAVMKYSEFYSTYIFKSTDGGANWYYLSQISVDDDIYFARNKSNTSFDGLCEPMMEVMPDGSVVMLMRTGKDQPSYLVRSTDNCKTWSKPQKFDDVGVLPQILTLNCGVTLASYGRPGLFLNSTGDSQGLIWNIPMEIPMTNPNVTTPSCYYTYLLPLSDTTALMVYTDNYYPNASGNPRKTVLARVISVIITDE